MNPENYLKFRIKKTTLAILKQGLIKYKKFYMSDLDYFLIADFDKKNCFVDLDSWAKTKNFDACMHNNFLLNEYPSIPEMEKAVKITDLEIFKNIKKFAVYASSDFTTRIALTCIYYGKKYMVATEGHILLKHPCKIEKDFLLPAKYAAMIDLISKEGIKEIYIDDNYLKIIVNGGTIYFRLTEGPFPDTDMHVSICNDIKLSELHRNELIAALTSIEPFTNVKTGTVFFDNTAIFCNDSETEKTYQVKLSFNLFKKFTCYNVHYLLIILRDISGDCIYTPEENSRKVVFKNDKQINLCMMLIIEDKEKQKTIIDLKIKAVKTKKQRVPVPMEKCKYISLKKVGEKFIVRQDKNKVNLGEITWNNSWQKYSFYPTAKCIFTASYLFTIGTFLNQLQEKK